MTDFIADEDIPRPVVEKLRSRGYSVFYVEEEMKGSIDEEVLESSRDRGLPILTFDSDFLRFERHEGICHITSRTNYDTVVEAVDDVLSNVNTSDLDNSVLQINPNNY